MENIPKSRRIGGKGTPRIPPKKTKESASDILDQTLLSHKKNTTKIDTTAAVIAGDQETITFNKPEMSAILCGKKEAICYILRGKGEVLQQNIKNMQENNEDVPDDFEKAAEEMLKKEMNLEENKETKGAENETKGAEDEKNCDNNKNI